MKAHDVLFYAGTVVACIIAIWGYRLKTAYEEEKSAKAEREANARETAADKKFQNAIDVIVAAQTYQAALAEFKKIADIPPTVLDNPPLKSDLSEAQQAHLKKLLSERPDAIIDELKQKTRLQNIKNASVEKTLRLDQEIRPKVRRALNRIESSIRAAADQQLVSLDRITYTANDKKKFAYARHEISPVSPDDSFSLLDVVFKYKTQPWAVVLRCGIVKDEDVPRNAAATDWERVPVLQIFGADFSLSLPFDLTSQEFKFDEQAGVMLLDGLKSLSVKMAVQR